MQGYGRQVSLYETFGRTLETIAQMQVGDVELEIVVSERTFDQLFSELSRGMVYNSSQLNKSYRHREVTLNYPGGTVLVKRKAAREPLSFLRAYE